MADGTLERAVAAENTATASYRLAGGGPKDMRWMGWAAMALLLAIWEIGCWAWSINSLYLPRPSQIVAAIVKLFASESLHVDLLWTLYRIFAGCGIAIVFGVLIGVWMAISPRAAAVADIFIAALYPLPKVTLIPLLVIWLGTGGPFMLTISALGAFFPIVINTLLGVRQCDPGLVLAARDLGASQSDIVRRVLIPSAVPSIFAGIRLGLGVSIILVVAAEMVVGKTGLGARLFLAGQILNTEDVFAVLIVLATLGILVTKAQDMIDERLARWRAN
jgi:ABC-type nitrate/sulfonate/bicarbonate transport system permease component